jgi:uncharacterized membrane protein (DUF373 family)
VKESELVADDTPIQGPSPGRDRASAPNGRRAAHRYSAFRGTHGLEAGESVIYLLVGACFLAAAALSLVFSILSFSASVLSFVSAIGTVLQAGPAPSPHTEDGALAIINFVSNLLLTLIILEVMGTVVRYLQSRATSLKPFLIIGIISATRGVLAVGARLSISGVTEATTEEFRRLMVELVINAAVIIALGVTLWLIGRRFGDEVEDTVTTDAAESEAH